MDSLNLISLFIVVIGLLGFLFNKENLIIYLICLEIVYNGFLFFSIQTKINIISGEAVSYYFSILSIIATEAVLGLAFVLKVKKLNKNIEVSTIGYLKD